MRHISNFKRYVLPIIARVIAWIMGLWAGYTILALLLACILYVHHNFVEQSSLYLKSSIGYIQMTGLVPTVFILFYTFIPVVTLILVLHVLLRRSKNRTGKGGA